MTERERLPEGSVRRTADRCSGSEVLRGTHKIELAQLLLAETDPKFLELVEYAVLGVPPLEVTESEIKDLERQVAVIDQE